MIFSPFPVGRGLLVVGDRELVVRVTLDTDSNCLVCNYPPSDFSIYGMRGESVSLLDVRLFSDGNSLAAERIDDLRIWEIGGGKVGVGDTSIGELTGRDGPPTRLRLAKQGQQVFELERAVKSQIEFAGGVDLARPVLLRNGSRLFSREGRIVVELADDEEDDALWLAVSLAFGHLCWKRAEVRSRSLIVVYQQSIKLSGTKGALPFSIVQNGWVDDDRITTGVKTVMECALDALHDDKGADNTHTLEWLTRWFLAARSVEGLLDFRAMSLFSFLEVVDGRRTLDGAGLAELLKISLDAAKALVKVRNGIVHGSRNLEQALREQPILDELFFGEFLVGDFAARPAATLMNYLVGKTNEIMLRRIGCDLAPARWV